MRILFIGAGKMGFTRLWWFDSKYFSTRNQKILWPRIILE